MDFKKKWNRFWTLNRHHEDGFTLVELIVVIAIMAILGGVGSVGYAGYIKSSNKNADKVLVGNIMRAIETGNNSYVHKLTETLQPPSSDAQIPVGFIVLTQNGGKAMESASTQAQLKSNSACKIETKTIAINITSAGTDVVVKDDGCGEETTNHSVYTFETETKRICTTHSVLQEENLRVWNSGVSGNTSNNEESTDAGSVVRSDKSTIIYEGNGHKDGQVKTESYYQTAVDAEGNYVTAQNDGMLYDSIETAFGKNPDLRLKYDGWTVSSIPSFWADASTTWKNVESMATMMNDLTSGLLGGTVSSLMGIGQYESAADIVYSVAGAINKTFDSKQDFIDQWATYGKATNDISGGDNFGLDQNTYAGREYYSALRASYNNCFASYVRQNHSSALADSHANALAGYGQSAGELVTEKVGNIPGLGDIANSIAAENFPRQLCKSAFTTEEGKSYLGAAKDCAECAALYNKYIEDGSDLADAAAVFDTFNVAANSDKAVLSGEMKDANGNKVDFFTYYGNYLKEFEALYSSVNDIIGDEESSIVISVYYQDGKVVCDVSPLEANPRP